MRIEMTNEMRNEMRNEIRNEIRNEMRNKMRNNVRNNVLFEDKALSTIVDLTSSFLVRVVSIFSNSKDKYVQFS
jgi:uncharacterized protein (UPF0218 family)